MPKSPRKKEPTDQAKIKKDLKALVTRKLTETHLFFEAGRIIASEVEPAELIRKVIASIGRAITFDNASVYLVKKDLSGLEPFYSTGPLFQDVKLDQLYLDYGAPGLIAATGEPLLIDNAEHYEGFLHNPDEPKQTGSYVGVALKSDARVLAVMGLSRELQDSFRIEEFDILRTLAHLIAAGLEKADLFKKTLELARVDELTGLFNYRVLMEKLEEEFRRQVRTHREFSFVMIDIDDFKRVNDRYGHLEGSRLLAQLGGLLKAAVRTDSTDNVYRYGGEEFSILMGETTLTEAEEVAERLRITIEEYPFSFKVAHPDEPLTVSMGVANMRAKTGKTVQQLINEADTALYCSKANGKNQVTRYTEGIRMPQRHLEQHR